MTLRRLDTRRRLTLLHWQVERIAARRIYMDLQARAANMPFDSPATWLIIADDLQIVTKSFLPKYRRATGYLNYDWYYDQWTIGYNVLLDDVTLSRILVHELAHWYQERLDTIWFLPFPYCYDGDVKASQHRIARRVDRMAFR